MVKTIIIENLGEIEKSEGKRIVLRLMELNGNRYLDIRTFALVDGSWEETYKGITLTKYSFPSFIALLNERNEEISDILDPMTPEEFTRKINRIKPRVRKSVNIRKGGIKKSMSNNQQEFNFGKKEVDN